MNKLTKKEEIIMNIFWKKGRLFVKELQDNYEEPKPHFNTLSTQVRSLEAEGFLAHNVYGNSFRYYPLITQDEYKKNTLAGVVKNYFGNSYLEAVSTLVREEKISVDELKELIDKIEKGK
jgi:predicted transcriptional regulator